MKLRTPRTVVLVSGSGSNLQAIIDQARAGAIDIEPVGVVSDRPDAFALVRARNAGIPAVTVDFRAAGAREAFAGELAEQLEKLAPDLVLLAGFMRILPGHLVERYAGRMLNVHPSLLPKYPGLDTYRRVLAAGDRWHGSTVHFVTPELDAGPAIIQFRLPVRPGDDDRSLRERVLRGEHVIYPRAVGDVAAGRVELCEGRVLRDGSPALTPLVMNEA